MATMLIYHGNAGAHFISIVDAFSNKLNESAFKKTIVLRGADPTPEIANMSWSWDDGVPEETLEQEIKEYRDSYLRQEVRRS